MGELWFDAEADAALTRLEDDPSRPTLLQAVREVLRQLEADPGHKSVRTMRFQLPRLWCVRAVGDDEDWVILWEPHPNVEGDVVVQYLGPASFP